VAALVLAARHEGSKEVYEIGGPEDVGLAVVAQRVIEACGRPSAIKHVPLLALRTMSVVARPFSPAFARLAQAAVLMNTTDMTVAAAWRERHPNIPVTTFADVLRATAPHV
jgi:hypothetical protein